MAATIKPGEAMDRRPTRTTDYSVEVANSILQGIRDGLSNRAACRSAGVHLRTVFGPLAWYQRGRGEDAVEPYITFADAVEDAWTERRAAEHEKLVGDKKTATGVILDKLAKMATGINDYLVPGERGRIEIDTHRMLADGVVPVKAIYDTKHGQRIEFYGMDEAIRELLKVYGAYAPDKHEHSGQIEMPTTDDLVKILKAKAIGPSIHQPDE